MSDEPENILLVYLRRLDKNLDKLTVEVQDLKQRVTSLDIGQAHIRREIADLHASYAGSQLRLDRIDSRLEGIERRLDLQEAH